MPINGQLWVDLKPFCDFLTFWMYMYSNDENPGFLTFLHCTYSFSFYDELLGRDIYELKSKCSVLSVESTVVGFARLGLFVNSEQTEHCSYIRSKKQSIKQMSICSSLLST